MRKESESVLIVDDDKSILRIFTRILERAGFRTEVAETGEEALGKVDGGSFDLALIDIKLPDSNGIDLLTRIRTTNPDTILITITGFPSVEEGVRALDRGAAAYLAKPINPSELLKIIEEKLGD